METRNETASSATTYQGWLRKKGRKRWFVIHNSILYWFAKEQKNVDINHQEIKGCLDLCGCKVVIESTSSKRNTFTISNLTTAAYYTLIADSTAEMDYCVARLTEAIEKASNDDQTASSASTHVERRGNLKKQGKERLFLLTQDSLTWFLSSSGSNQKAKGSLSLRGASLSRGKPPYSFVVTPRTGKRFELVAHNQAECDEWSTSISDVITRLNNFAESGGEREMKSGWLDKKGKKRWFSVRKGKLLWFKRAIGSADDVPTGSLLLLECSVAPLPVDASGKYGFDVRIIPKAAPMSPRSPSPKASSSAKQPRSVHKTAYIIYALSEGERNDWVNCLVRAGAKLEISEKNTTPRNSGPTSPREPSDQKPESVSPTTGTSPTASTPTTPAGRPSISASSGWVTATLCRTPPINPPPDSPAATTPLSQSSKSSWRNSVTPIGWASSSSKDAGGNAPLVSFSPSSYTPRSSTSAQPPADGPKANATATPESGEPKEKSGWLLKKGKRRWFVLQKGVLAWYNQPQQLPNGRTSGRNSPNGQLQIAFCSLAFTGQSAGYYSLSITHNTEKVEYTLMASSKEECEAWITALKHNGAAGGKAETTVTAAELRKDNRTSGAVAPIGTTIPNDRNGWLDKKGKKRWFLLRNGVLAWYNEIQSLDGLSPNGFLVLRECTVEKLAQPVKGKHAFVLTHHDPGTATAGAGARRNESFTLLHQSAAEIDDWVEILVQKGGATVAVSKGDRGLSVSNEREPTSAKFKLFGVSIEEALKAQKPLNVQGIPRIMEVCVNCIRQRGMRAEGLFRVSGETYEVSHWRKRFESGEDIQSIPEDVEIHTVTSLLKQFVREMDPPLVTYGLYGEFVEAAGASTAQLLNLLNRLPRCNYRVMGYLMVFLNDVSKESAWNKMAAMNLAIVFGPNMLRNKGGGFELLANSARVGSLTQSLVTDAYELFPEAREWSGEGEGQKGDGPPNSVAGDCAPQTKTPEQS